MHVSFQEKKIWVILSVFLCSGIILFLVLLEGIPTSTTSSSSLESFVHGTGEAIRADLSFGADPLQEMEIYYRKDQQHAPAVVIFHGGSEDVGDKSRMRDFAQKFSDQGYTTVLPNYRYGTPPDKLSSRDVMCAVATFAEQADAYQSNRQKILVVGFSHGGYVSSLAVFNQTVDWLEGCAVQTPPHIAGFIGVATNFGSPNTEGTRAVLGIHSDEEVIGRYDDISQARDGAINYIDANDPPSLLVHGTADPKFNERRSIDLGKILAAAGVPVTVHVVEGGTHTANLLTAQETLPDLRAFVATIFK